METKNKLAPTYDIFTPEDLGRFLLGAIRDVRKNELKVEEAMAISCLADKYIKNRIAMLLETRINKQQKMLNIDAELNKGVMQKISSTQDIEHHEVAPTSQPQP